MNLAKALTFILVALGVNPAQSTGDALVFPDVISSADGLLDFTLTLEYGTHKVNGYKLKNTRMLNGQLPGPTIKVKAGDEMRILFKNKLKEQGSRVTTHNKFSYPDTSNLHFHGSHVSGELPSDDVTLSVDPGDSYQYITNYPASHMPGTHWLHPHVHGSGALQVRLHSCDVLYVTSRKPLNV
jgi:FtsP/CotA-like multicopper oxidase with cupredoxin domain